MRQFPKRIKKTTSRALSFLILFALLCPAFPVGPIQAQTETSTPTDQAIETPNSAGNENTETPESDLNSLDLENSELDQSIDQNLDQTATTPPATAGEALEALPDPQLSEINQNPLSLTELLAALPDSASFAALTLDQQAAILLPIFRLVVAAESTGQLVDGQAADLALENLFSGLVPDQQEALLSQVYQDLGIDPSPAAGTGTLPETVVFTDAAPLVVPEDLELGLQAVPHAQTASLTGRGSGSNDPYSISDKLILNKTVSKVLPNDTNDKQYEITLEAYTTEKLFQGGDRIHASDIILLVDQGRKMVEIGNATSKVKEAVSYFIEQIKADAGEDKDHRIGYVAFSGRTTPNQGLSNDYDAVKDSFTSNYKTNEPQYPSVPNQALKIARDFFSNSPPTPGTRNKIVVLITASNPSNLINNNFKTNLADSAIEIANDMKSSGTTFYSVGLFNGANNSVTHGDEQHHLDLFTHYSTGLPNSYWQNQWSAPRQDIDLPAANRFLNYLSSNFYDPDQARATLGLNFRSSVYDSSLPLLQRLQSRYTIIYNMPFKGTRGYYLTGGIDNLQTALSAIAKQIERPPAAFGDQIRLQDTLSDYFSFPTGFAVDDIKVYTQACTGKDQATGEYQFNPDLVELTDPQIVKSVTNQPGNPDGTGAIHNINVLGFNFDQNYCREVSDLTAGYGYKLVIKYKILKEGAGNFGGGEFPTGIDSTSGAYIDIGQQAIANFPECNLDEPIDFKVYEPEMAYGMYYGNLLRPGRAVPFANLSTQSTDDLMYPDGQNNKYVDIYYTFKGNGQTIGHFKIPAGGSASLLPGVNQNSWLGGSQPLKPDQDATYHVEVRMLPKGDTFIPDNLPLDPNTAETTVNIYIYKPAVELTDSTVPFGTYVNLKGRVNDGEQFKTWVLASDPTNPNSIPLPDSADRPNLVFKYLVDETEVTPSLVESYPVTADTPVTLKISLDLADGYNQQGLTDGEDVTNQTYYKKNSQAGTFQVPFPHFTINVKLDGIITIDNKFDRPVIYHLQGPDNTTDPGLSIIAPKNRSIKITDLPYGDYNLSQHATGTWPYPKSDLQTVTLSPTDKVKTCTFGPSQATSESWFNGLNLRPNQFTNPVIQPNP